MESTQEKQIAYHYHGDKVRILFVIMGVLMAGTLPLFSSMINLPISISIVGILLLAILGGFLNPAQKWIIYLDTLASIVAFISFEYYAVYTYMNLSPAVALNVYFYWVNQIAALLFFLATYLCVKTLRGRMLS
ncbi:MAG: hypothetical protein NTX85_00505 [Candidatus Nomurabacteria bacterium]|nr:hypothetical protein [Candidatus Nomurabacteria bacterium]